MRRLVSCIAIIICLVLLMPVLLSCTRKLEPENTFLELLTLLPESAKEAGVFALIDYKHIWQANGISTIDKDGNSLSQEEFLNMLLDIAEERTLIAIDAISLGSYYTGWGTYMLSSSIQDEYVGFDYTDVNAEINNINIRPSTAFGPIEKYDFEPDLMAAAIGSYSQKATQDAFSNRDEWPTWAINNYATEKHRGIVIHSWGDSTKFHSVDSLSPPHLDTAGRARLLAVSDGYLFVGCSVDDIKSMIDASRDKSPSLADVPEYALIAEGMCDLGAFGVIIANEALANGPPLVHEYDNSPRLKRFLTFGTGPGNDEKGEYMALVLVHESPSEAKENVLLLERRIGMLTWFEQDLSDVIYDAEIHAEGEVLMAKLYTDAETLWHSWFFSRGTLLLHEQ